MENNIIDGKFIGELNNNPDITKYNQLKEVLQKRFNTNIKMCLGVLEKHKEELAEQDGYLTVEDEIESQFLDITFDSIENNYIIYYSQEIEGDYNEFTAVISISTKIKVEEDYVPICDGRILDGLVQVKSELDGIKSEYYEVNLRKVDLETAEHIFSMKKLSDQTPDLVKEVPYLVRIEDPFNSVLQEMSDVPIYDLTMYCLPEL
ncbi:MAG TPA: hypothetical protein DEP72_01735 [Clostridiales bacterium]|nr:MAG: hypothetical protein A2Y18_07650 [Clostridiales bacterium GWD2_32_19]HCC06875.1 hypothetical protein [Clostridiales bacterium]